MVGIKLLYLLENLLVYFYEDTLHAVNSGSKFKYKHLQCKSDTKTNAFKTTGFQRYLEDARVADL